MKKLVTQVFFLVGLAVLYGCTNESQGADRMEADTIAVQTESGVPNVTDTEKEDENKNVELQRERELLLSVNGNVLSVSWEDNDSVKALREMVQDGDISIYMTPYGGFEQVGSLPDSITSNNVQMTAYPGDIVLYAGSSLVLFYGTNSWNYTKLGHIEEVSLDELQALLDREEVIVEISFAE